MHWNDIVLTCQKDETKTLTEDDIICALDHIDHHLRHTNFLWLEKGDDTFAQVTDVLMCCARETARRLGAHCAYNQAINLHDLAQSGKELYWSVANDGAPDTFVTMHGQQVRQKGRGPWLAMTEHLRTLAQERYATYHRVIPSFKTSILWTKDKQALLRQSKTCMMCAITASDLTTDEQRTAFAHSKLTEPEDMRVRYVAVSAPSDILAPDQILSLLKDAGLPYAEKTARDYALYELPLIELVAEGSITLLPDILAK